MHNEYSDEAIAKLYRDYQDSRTGQHSQGRWVVLGVLKAHRNAIEQKTKQAVMAQVMQAVRERDNAHIKSSNGSNHSRKNKPSGLHGATRRIYSAIHKRIKGTPTWQYALPSLALITIIFGLLPQLSQKESSPTQVAVNQQESLIKFSEQLAPSIQTVTGTEFGFSNTQDVHTAAFNLGVVSVDLPILAHASNHGVISETLAQVYPAAKSSKNINVEKQLLILKTSLAKSANDKSNVYQESVQLAESLKELVYGNEQLAFYEFGEWLEVSILASLISSIDKEGHLLKQQLKKRAGVFNKLLKNTPANTQPLNRLLTELDTMATNDALQTSGIRKLQHKLNQIKAFLQE